MARKKKARRKKAAKKEKVKGMLLDAASLGVYKMAADDDRDMRYALANVRLEPDGTTVATTGYMMVAVQHGSANADDFPDVGEPAAIPKNGALIPCDVCADVIKAMPKHRLRPVLANALLTRCGKDGVELATTDLSRTKKVGAPEVEGTFPDWRDMLAHENRDRPVGFTIGTRVLKKLLDTLGPHLAQDSAHGPALRFEFSPTQRGIPAADAPVLVRGNLKAERGGKVLALVAPVLVRHMSDEDPDPNIRPEFSDWEKGVLGWEDRDDEAPDVPRLRDLVYEMCRLLVTLTEASSEDSAPTRRCSDLLLAAADELVSGVNVDAELHAVTDARDIVAEAVRVLRGLPVEEPKTDEDPDYHPDDPADDDPADDPPEDGPTEEPAEEGVAEEPVIEDAGVDADLSPTECGILACLSSEARSLDDIVSESGLSPAEVSAGMLVLEIRRLAGQLPGKMFERMPGVMPEAAPVEEPAADDEPLSEDSPDEAPEDPSDDPEEPLEEIVDDTPSSPPPDDDFDLDAILGD